MLELLKEGFELSNQSESSPAGEGVETPEEYVRQEIAKSLVREYGYQKPDVEVEFIVRLGSRKPRADLVIFPPATAHTQDKALIDCRVQGIDRESSR